jgi:hypothetical protein
MKAISVARLNTATGALARMLGLLSLLLLAVVLACQAQSPVDWSTIDGGGGTSTGGIYTVSGTFGQPDAGTLRDPIKLRHNLISL